MNRLGAAVRTAPQLKQAALTCQRSSTSPLSSAIARSRLILGRRFKDSIFARLRIEVRLVAVATTRPLARHLMQRSLAKRRTYRLVNLYRKACVNIGHRVAKCQFQMRVA